MASVIRITESEILEAIADASKGTAPKDARTVAELAETIGRASDTVRGALRKLNAQGRLRVHHVPRIGIDGRRFMSPAYTVLPAKRKR